MDIDNDYPLSEWRDSELLKTACRHVEVEPAYVKMDPEAWVEMKRFCHAFRRVLMTAKETYGSTPQTLEHLHSKYGFIVTTFDHLRYLLNVHGHCFAIITGIPDGHQDQ